jgi:hypothetical protein
MSTSTVSSGVSSRLSSPLGRAVVWAVAIVVWCALAGYVAGRIWMTRWHAPTGQALDHVWYPAPWDEGNKAAFAATAWFALIGFPLGLITGFLAGWLSQARELVTLGAVLVGTCLAAWVMVAYGMHISPPDPAAAAKKAADGTVILGSLARPGYAVMAVVPAGAVAVLAAIYLLGPRSNK